MKDKIIAILEKHEIEFDCWGGGPEACYFAVNGNSYEKVANEILGLFNWLLSEDKDYEEEYKKGGV